MHTNWAIFSNIGALFIYFLKRQGKPPTLPLSSCAVKLGHTKAALYARGVNKSCKMITFSHLNFSNLKDNFKDNFMLEKVKSTLVVLILSFAPFFLFIIFTFGSVFKLLFDDLFHIAFGHIISLLRSF